MSARTIAALGLAAGLGGCYVLPPCGGGGSTTCDAPAEPEPGRYEVGSAEPWCTGGNRAACLEDAALVVEDEEIVLRWTDEDGHRWEAAWVRTQ